MELLSILIPNSNDPLLAKTIQSLRDNAEGEIEILVMDNKGMRSAINAGLKQAKGDYIMKCDAHCIFGKGYDRIMIENCQDNWLLIPRRYSLNEEKWERDETRIKDYHSLSFPEPSEYGAGMFPYDIHKQNDIEIDDTLSFQGSCWFANRKYFMNLVGYLDKEHYGEFASEPIEIGMKYWLGGGEVKVIKKTWYAHLSKRKHHYDTGVYHRSYKKSNETINGHTWASNHWLNNEEPNMVRPLSWLIDKFKPTGWEKYDNTLRYSF